MTDKPEVIRHLDRLSWQAFSECGFLPYPRNGRRELVPPLPLEAASTESQPRLSSKVPDEARQCRPRIIFVNLQVHPPFHWHRGECAVPIPRVGSNFFCDANQTIRHRGFHVADCSQGYLWFWIGHAGKSVTDGYSMVKGDVAFRQLCAANVGLGFELPAINSSDKPAVAPIVSCYQVLRKIH
jgi:hypothetical protein